MKIGITFSLMNGSKDSIWTNGLKLNIMIFIDLLKQSKKNYDVFLLGYGGDIVNDKPDFIKDIEIYDYKEKYMDCDLIIMMGQQVPEDTLINFKKNPNKKVIAYKCGNNYIINLENILFRDDTKNNLKYERIYDEVWYVPQQHDTNFGYFKTLYRTTAISVPFIWSHKYLLEVLVDIENSHQRGSIKKGFKYQPKEVKDIGIMEPNINIVKFCTIPLLIAEESYRTETGKNKIGYVSISNVNDTLHKNEFMNMVRSLDLNDDKKISVEGRYKTGWAVTQYFDVIISHQLLNPLNYLYLDIAYMGYPVLHNAPMCKDIGYYYEGSNTVDGAEKLNWILENHDDHIDEYVERNKEALYRYHYTNEDLIETYDTLIHNLFNGGNDISLKYNADTNLYDNLSKNKTIKLVKEKKTKRKK
jgi:hypothetical protein